MNVRDMIENFSSTPFSFRGRQKTSSSTIYWQISSVKSCLKIHLFQSSTFHVQYNLHNQPWQMYACALESSATTAVAFCFKSLLLWHIFKINGSQKKKQHAYFYHTTEMHKNKAYNWVNWNGYIPFGPADSIVFQNK